MITNIICVQYLETERGENGFDLMRTIEAYGKLINGKPRLEIIEHWQTDDRLLAAIINLGYACRWFHDTKIYNGFIDIKTDTDGQDHKYSNEHNILYGLINPSDGWQARKNASLYQEYQKYLWRIHDLTKANNIRIDLV